MNDRPRILVVEDSPTQALRLQLRLSQENWEVLCSGSTEEAFHEVERQAPDLMLVDYYLPRMRGDEFCRRIRMNINTRNIPIIMLTASEAEDVQVRLLESGADDFFRKSTELEVLVVRIRKMLERSHGCASVLAAEDARFKQARILTVDDSETYLAHLNTLLTNEGYRVEHCLTGSDALQRMSQEQFDCVLVDLVMPQMDGIEVCRQIVSIRERFDNPIAVLMLTGREGKEDLTRALEAGADDFVGKSSDEAVLKGRLRALLRRKFYQEENERILKALRDKELEAANARAEAEAAVARAAEERRREAEEIADQLQAAKDALEESNHELMRFNDELRQFAYVASHDLQEPIRSITSFCHIIQSTYADALDDEGRDYVERIVAGALRMKELIRSILCYSRVAGDEGQSFAMVDCEAVIQGAIADLEASIRESGATITLDNIPSVWGNRQQLLQLFENLLGNAIKYRSRQPPQIHISCQTRDDCWQFSIRDNGLGIAEEHRERIFEIFKRLHDRKTYPGTGIGLSLCRRISQAHGGSIWAEAAPVSGSVFHFTISRPVQETDHAESGCVAATP